MLYWKLYDIWWLWTKFVLYELVNTGLLDTVRVDKAQHLIDEGLINDLNDIQKYFDLKKVTT